MTTMRAKVRVTGVTKGNGQEHVQFQAVAASNYPADGSDEDNTYACFSPQADFSITIANPALFGKFEAEQRFYVDFSPADGGATVSSLQQITGLLARIAELEALLDGGTRTVNVDASARLADCIGDLGELALGCSAGHTIVLPDNLAPGDHISVTLSKARADEGEQP